MQCDSYFIDTTLWYAMHLYTVQLDYTHTLHKYKKSGGSNAHPWHIAYV